jgi:hypothetical protein
MVEGRMSYVDDRPPYVDFSEDELRFIGRLARNLLACAVDAGLDPGVVESVYYKTQEFCDD